MSGIIFAALKLILRQESQFPLSQVQLDKAYSETIQLSIFNCSLQNVLRLEYAASLLNHYNLLTSKRNDFGSDETPVLMDWYNTDETARTVTTTLLRGALFSRRLFNNRSQKSRYLRLPITFDRLCFSRVGEASESSFELSEVLSINPLESDAGMPGLRILLTSRREIVLQCELGCERNRWCFYVKVVLNWYRLMGKGLIMSMLEKMDEVNKVMTEILNNDENQLVRIENENELNGIHQLVMNVVSMIRQSLEAFIEERTIQSSSSPMNVNLECKCVSD